MPVIDLGLYDEIWLRDFLERSREYARKHGVLVADYSQHPPKYHREKYVEPSQSIDEQIEEIKNAGRREYDQG